MCSSETQAWTVPKSPHGGGQALCPGEHCGGKAGLRWLGKCAPGRDQDCKGFLKHTQHEGLLLGESQSHPPSFFIPARKHFLSLQYRHWFLLSLSTTHCLLNLGRKKQRKKGVRSSKTEAEGRTRRSPKLQDMLRVGSQRVTLRKEP